MRTVAFLALLALIAASCALPYFAARRWGRPGATTALVAGLAVSAAIWGTSGLGVVDTLVLTVGSTLLFWGLAAWFGLKVRTAAAAGKPVR